ncbi:toxin-antitoxin system YwqK family antitoxin [Marinobacter oulmenensis]|uniref:Antitoxin component YwqK of YwqJK toxin-antitoxin module n=1 Tax=Marinobacter oulmenensis TaxID=643747 RepID=A0A840UHA9_9GAMM|nr:hypothetical protein [Marinobacter oulmenensis]MBB5320188.1 antitoxin component YwqK of YwqJK toxin-antitoxin module [Marinobacter oulmenensis]
MRALRPATFAFLALILILPGITVGADQKDQKTVTRETVTIEGHGKGTKTVTTYGNFTETRIEAGDYSLFTKKRGKMQGSFGEMEAQLVERQEKVGDTLVGLYITTSDLEPLTTSVPYLDGKKHGLYKEEWWGQTIARGQYDHGKRVGEWMREGDIFENYDSQGQLHGESRSLDTAGNLIELKTYNHGVLDGPYKKLSRGKLQTAGMYKNGKKSGQWQEIAPYKGTKSIGSYRDGERQGAWKFYDRNGYLSKQATYEEGEYNGPLYELREDGSLASIEIWKDGKRQGYPTYYDK